MNQQQLDQLRSWFDGYVAAFCGRDPYVDTHLQLKYHHSLRTAGESRMLAKQLRWDGPQCLLAETIGLLHDVGRFEQFVRYRTYSDLVSIDHSTLGVEVLQRAGPLGVLALHEQDQIQTAIRYHSRMELPSDLDGPALPHCQLIRDADKLDIFYIVVDNYRQLAVDPANLKIELDLPDTPGYSPMVAEATIQGRHVDWRQLRTLNDVKLMQLGWVYDINFPAALRRIRQQKYLEQILTFLPDAEDIRRARHAVLQYADQRLAEHDGSGG